jgi:hypothetical protein
MHIKQRMTVMSATLAVLTLGIGGAIGIPSILAVQKSVADIGLAQARLDDRYALRRYMSKAANDIADKKKRVAPLADAALHEGDELAFVTAIETAASSSGVTEKLTLETANQTELSPWEREIPVTVTAQGTYPAMASFIDALQRMSYLFDMSAMDLSPVVDKQPGTVRLEVHGVTYWLGNLAPDFVHGHADAIPLPTDAPPAAAANAASANPL